MKITVILPIDDRVNLCKNSKIKLYCIKFYLLSNTVRESKDGEGNARNEKGVREDENGGS